MIAAADPALAQCPFPGEASAAPAAKTVLDENRIACANILPMRSLFVWNGEPGDATEAGMLVRTDTALLDRVMARLASLHRFDDPAIVGWPCPAATAGTGFSPHASLASRIRPKSPTPAPGLRFASRNAMSGMALAVGEAPALSSARLDTAGDRAAWLGALCG